MTIKGLVQKRRRMKEKIESSVFFIRFVNKRGRRKSVRSKRNQTASSAP